MQSNFNEEIAQRPLPLFFDYLELFDKDFQTARVAAKINRDAATIIKQKITPSFAAFGVALAELKPLIIDEEQNHRSPEVPTRTFDKINLRRDSVERAEDTYRLLGEQIQTQKESLTREEPQLLEQLGLQGQDEIQSLIEDSNKLELKLEGIRKEGRGFQVALTQVNEQITSGCCSCFSCCVPKKLRLTKAELLSSIQTNDQRLNEEIKKVPGVSHEEKVKRQELLQRLQKVQEDYRKLVESEAKTKEDQARVCIDKEKNLLLVEEPSESKKEDLQVCVTPKALFYFLRIYQHFLELKKAVDNNVAAHQKISSLQVLCNEAKPVFEHYMSWIWCADLTDVKAKDMYDRIEKLGLIPDLLKNPFLPEKFTQTFPTKTGPRQAALLSNKAYSEPHLFFHKLRADVEMRKPQPAAEGPTHRV